MANSYGKTAEQIANSRYTAGTPEWDAFKHVYWHALMVADDFGFQWSQGLGRAHEGYSNNVDRPGDLENNRHGALIGQQFKDGRLQGDMNRYVEDFVRNGHANTTANCRSCRP